MALKKFEKQEELRRVLRLFLNDTPELNRLTRKQESSDEKLDLAIKLALDDYNITPPHLGTITIEKYPSLFLLLYGATIQLLRSNGILQSRNELSYSTGGMSVQIFDKTKHYQSWIAQFVSEYESKKRHFKIAQNIHNALGAGVFSEYSLLGHFA